MKNFKLDKKATLLILILLGAFLILSSMFLLIGLTSKNISFFLPRRFVKIATVALVGYSVSYSSVTFQTITNNKLLTPSVIGLDSLYMFIQTVIVLFSGAGTISMFTGHMNFIISVVLMVICSCVLFICLFRGQQKNVYFLILVGMIIGNLFGGMSTFMQVLMDPNEFSIVQDKMFASFNNINQDLLGISFLVVLISFVITLKDNAKLDVVSLGQDHAINLGVSYQKIVLKNLMNTAVLVSVSTALVGPITFLGILVVSVSRKLVNTYKHSYRIIITSLVSMVLLISTLLFTERILQFTTTMSVLINFIGGSIFIYMILKEKKG
ncbi:MAG TPA: iron ABC transporter permease [Clostridiales bacterium]|nr:iron ABC transporter permease [Clostridiales bacterium]